MKCDDDTFHFILFANSSKLNSSNSYLSFLILSHLANRIATLKLIVRGTMAEGAAATNPTGFISTSTRFIEVIKSSGPCLGLLLTIVGIGIESKNTFKETPLLIMPLVFIVDVLYLALVYVTMFELQIENFLDLLFRMVIVLIGIDVSFLALMIISPTIALIHLGLWFLTFAFVCYKIRIELYQFIPKRINSNDMSIHNSEIP